MALINIITDNEHYDSVLRQIPSSGYEGLQFEVNKSGDCDVLVVFEYAKHDIHVNCAPENTWIWSMEPPDEEWEWLRKGYKYFSRIVTIDEELRHSKIIHNQLAIPWQIDKSYDELKEINYFSNKSKDLSFITSNYAARKGHRRRLRFLQDIQDIIPFDLWGRGFRNMNDKTEGLLPYKYTIVVENSRYKNYWSEKLADAFLCGCLPFYYGCPNVNDYFPSEALIKIDINDPDTVTNIITSAMNNMEWEKRQAAIEMARNKILNEYQFFPTFINLLQHKGISESAKQELYIPQLSHHPSVIHPYSLSRNYYLLKKWIFRRRYLDLDSPYFGFTTYK